LPTGLLSLASSRHEIGTGRVLKILVQHIIKEFRPSFVGWGGRMKRVPGFDQNINLWKKKELITSEDNHPEITLLLFHDSLVMDSAKTKTRRPKGYNRLVFSCQVNIMLSYRKGKLIARWGRKVMDPALAGPPDCRIFFFGSFLFLYQLVGKGGLWAESMQSLCSYQQT